MIQLKKTQREFQTIKLFINEYNWDGIKYSSKIDDWKTFEKNNPTISLNVLYTKEINGNMSSL